MNKTLFVRDGWKNGDIVGDVTVETAISYANTVVNTGNHPNSDMYVSHLNSIINAFKYAALLTGNQLTYSSSINQPTGRSAIVTLQYGGVGAEIYLTNGQKISKNTNLTIHYYVNGVSLSCDNGSSITHGRGYFNFFYAKDKDGKITDFSLNTIKN